VGFDFLSLRQESRIRAEHLNECLDFGFGGLFQFDLIVGLRGGEKIESEDFLKPGVNAIDTSRPLHQASWVPWDIVVDHHIRPMQIDTFGENLGGDKDAVVIFRELGSGIKIGGDLLPGDSA